MESLPTATRSPRFGHTTSCQSVVRGQLHCRNLSVLVRQQLRLLRPRRRRAAARRGGSNSDHNTDGRRAATATVRFFSGCSMLSLRRYQEEALHALFGFWRNGGGNPLIGMATGLGKSVIIAFLVKQLLADYPEMRVLITAPNRELIDQDIQELLRVWPEAPIGINCDGLDQRDTDTQILFVLVNSVYRNPKALGNRDLIIVDESHFIPHHEQGMYRATIDALRELVPDLRVVGLTATPYRLDSGHLCEGESRIFDSI